MTTFYQSLARYLAILGVLLLGFGLTGWFRKQPSHFHGRWLLIFLIVGQLPLWLIVVALYRQSYRAGFFSLDSPATLLILLLFVLLFAAYYLWWQVTRYFRVWGVDTELFREQLMNWLREAEIAYSETPTSLSIQNDRPAVSIALSPSFATGWVILAQAQERRLLDQVIHLLRCRLPVSQVPVRGTSWLFTMLPGAALFALGLFLLFGTSS
jgi:hypothetical protein